MLKNYLTIATRNLYKNLGYSAINVFGLAIGLACCLLVTLYVKQELSYEQFHQNKDSIYRYVPRGERNGEVRMQTMLPAGFAPLMKENFHEVEMFTRYSLLDSRPLMRSGDNFLDAKNFCMVDPDFFKMFSFPITTGNKESFLDKPMSIALARSVAEKYFPGGDALGKTIQYDNAFDFEVTGIFEDVPANTHLEFTYVTTFETAAKIMEEVYGMPARDMLSNLDSWNYSAYFFIPQSADIDELAARMDQKFTEARKESFNPAALSDWLQPLNEIHFTKGIKGDSANGDITYVYIFTAVAILILLVASFNFMNLSTARAIKRAKEVGLRKVMGAFRHQLIKQFLGETIVLVAVAMILAAVFLAMLIPVFNALIDQQLEVHYFGPNSIIGYFILIALATGLLAGSYPAFYLSSFAPARVLKGLTGISGKSGLRKVLTVLQFGVAVFLVTGTIVVYQQMNFIRHTQLGFDQENIIYMSPPNPLWEKRDVFRDNLLANSSIRSVSFSNGTPGMENATWMYAFPTLEIPKRSMNTMIVDYDFINTFGLEILEGRGLSPEFATDSAEAYIINEAAVEELMLDKPIGTAIQALDGHPEGRIIGVVKNFHYRSLHRKIEPLVIRFDPRNMWCMSVKFTSGSLSANLAIVENEWKKISPDYPFTYQFVDDTIERQYKAEQNTGVLVSSFALLAILIACLGLLGLTAFMAEQRKKEIGVRKVLGASVPGIMLLLSKDFSRLLLIAFILVVPLAWYAMNQWLTDFAYRITISPLLFLVAGAVVMVIAFVSVFYQSLKAAVVNPGDTLRNE